MNSAMRSRLVPVARRLFSTGKVVRDGQVHPKYQKVKELQQKFQADVGHFVPVRHVLLTFVLSSSIKYLYF